MNISRIGIDLAKNVFQLHGRMCFSYTELIVTERRCGNAD